MNVTRRQLALATVALPFALGAGAARALVAQSHGEIAVELAQPLPVVTHWGTTGTFAFAILAATIACASLALLAAVRSYAPYARASDVVAVLAVATLTLAAAAAWPFVFSSDTYAYAAYGSMAQRGLDPYLLAPPGAHDAFLEAARRQWDGVFPVDVYGPGMLLISRLAVVLGANSVAPTIELLRLGGALAFLGSAVLLHLALAGVSQKARFVSLCAYALNPVVLWSVAEGHNDAFLLLVVAGAALAVRRGFPIVGAVVLGLSPLLKAPGALLAAGFAAGLPFVRSVARARTFGALAGGTALAAALTLPPLLPALHVFAKHGRYEPAASLQSLIGLVPALLLALAASAYGLRALMRGERRGFAWLGIALVLALPNVYPWYALWIVPWAIAAGSGFAAAGLWGATIFSIVRYLPDASGTLTGTASQLAAAVAAFPLCLAFAELGLARPKKAIASS